MWNDIVNCLIRITILSVLMISYDRGDYFITIICILYVVLDILELWSEK